MAFDPKNAVNAAKDIAAHAVGKAADIVEDAGQIIKGDIAGGASYIVEDSIAIGNPRRGQGQRGHHRQERLRGIRRRRVQIQLRCLNPRYSATEVPTLTSALVTTPENSLKPG